MDREKLERGHDGPKPVTAKCCHALLPSDKVDVNYIATSIFLRVHHPLFKAGDDKLIFGSYNRAIYSIHYRTSRCAVEQRRFLKRDIQ